MAEIVTMPKLGFDMAEGTLVRWVIQEGEPVAKGAILAEIETDKATVEVESAFDGVVARHLVKEGEIVPVNTPIAVIGASGESVDIQAIGKTAGAASIPGVKEVAGSSMPAETAVSQGQEVQTGLEAGLPDGFKASPLARKMALEQGIDLRGVSGSGPGGRITKKDLEAYLAAQREVVGVTRRPLEAPPPVAFSPAAQMPAGQTVPVSRLRGAIGRRMTEAKQQVPHFYVTYEYDMAALMALRSEVNSFLTEEEKTSVNDYIVKAVALTLREFPNLNATLNGSEIIRHGQVNIGVAVAVESGLLTVVCREADLKPIRQISSDIRVMAARVREGKVRPDDIEGSTFSVSNLGMFNVQHFIAIINPPEAAILAIGAVQEVPVVKGGQVLPGLRMKATISVDHRVSDGAEAAKYLRLLQRFLEEPLRLLV